jgi:hypothetical protein
MFLGKFATSSLKNKILPQDRNILRAFLYKMGNQLFTRVNPKPDRTGIVRLSSILNALTSSEADPIIPAIIAKINSSTPREEEFIA